MHQAGLSSSLSAIAWTSCAAAHPLQQHCSMQGSSRASSSVWQGGDRPGSAQVSSFPRSCWPWSMAGALRTLLEPATGTPP